MTHQPPDKNALRITEEVFNSITHGVAAIAALVGLMVGMFTISVNATARFGFFVYGVSLILLMTISCLYHALIFSHAKNVFQILDRSSIFILIAGSYTPFIIYLYQGWLQIMVLTIVWGIAVGGVLINSVKPKRAQKIGMSLYIGFGWLALILLPRIYKLDGRVVMLLVLGGILYTVGALLLIMKKPYIHVGWHIFVVGAAIAHYFAILLLLS